MPTEADRPAPRVNPRPGVVKTLGICNVVFSALSGFCIFGSAAWWIGAKSSGAMRTPTKVVASTGPGQPVISFNPFMGMDEPRFVRFSVASNATGMITGVLMFATGIGLINLRRWAARWWTYLAWAKIFLAVLLWGYYIVALAPALSESMARNILAVTPPNRGRMTMAELTTIYSIMNLIVAVVVILFSSIYPVISLWLLGRPGVKAALIDKPALEPGLP